VIRRLRDDMVAQVEVTIDEKNTAAAALFRSLSFEPVDTGVVYLREGYVPDASRPDEGKAPQDQHQGQSVEFRRVPDGP